MNARIKKSVTCADVFGYSIEAEPAGTHVPRAGDVGLFEVLSVGKDRCIQDVTRRMASIFPGDQILAAFDGRCAPGRLDRYHVVGPGGAIGFDPSAAPSPAPTVVKLLGYAIDTAGRVVNTKALGGRRPRFSGRVPGGARVIVSLGTSAKSGKTTTAGYLARSLKQLGETVAYVKLTGSALTTDMEFVHDCGADFVSDFSQAGFPSTSGCNEDELLDLYQRLLDDARSVEPDSIIVELGDGLYQTETVALLFSPRFKATVSSLMLSSEDSTSAMSAVRALTAIGAAPTVISGTCTRDRREIEDLTLECSVPTATLAQLMTPDCARQITGRRAEASVPVAA
jgi:hypothetical protein